MKDKGRLPPFVALLKDTLNSPAWRAMSHGARSLNTAIRSHYNFQAHNNGRLYLSHRLAAKVIGSSTNQVTRWFEENQYYGFLRQTKPGYLGVDGKGQSPRWRLTDLGYMKDPPTRDFLYWNGVRFSKHQAGGDRPKKQNPVPEKGDAPSLKRGTPPSLKRGTLIVATVPEKGDKERPQTVPEKGDKSYKPLGRVGGTLPEERDKPLSLPLMTVIAGGGTPRCAQCGGNGEPLFKFKNGSHPYWLHRRCRTKWLAERVAS
jgi:hypothetical protein